MTIKYCPRCIQRYTVDEHSGDFVHECSNASLTLTQEDRVITGQTVEEFGQTVDTGVKPGEVMYQGVQNRFFGQRAGVEGARFQGVTRRGANAATNRQRQYYNYDEGNK